MDGSVERVQRIWNGSLRRVMVYRGPARKLERSCRDKVVEPIHEL